MTDPRKTILLVEDDEAKRDALTDTLRQDHRVLRTATGEAALQIAQKEDIGLVILDLRLPGIGGLEVLRILKENYPYVEVIAISAAGELDAVIEAMRAGAYHCIASDFDAADVRALVARASERQDLNRSIVRLNAEVAAQHDREFVVGPSRATRDVLEKARRAARTPVTVLVLGESGTGKELLAKMIHRESAGPGAPFVAVNLAAIPRDLVESTLFGHERGSFTGAVRQQLGKFELASGGTLFLDEIGDLPFDLQAKLLRAVQEGEIERLGGNQTIRTNFRLVCATNTDLSKAVREGRFREDLYYRINVVNLKMPALRDRIEDVPVLARFFLRHYSDKFGKPVRDIADSTLEIMARYWWPGNIRELENLIERLVALSDKEWITDEDLPYELHVAPLEGEGPSTGNVLDLALETFERNFIIRALEKNQWNVTATARALGVPLSTLKFRMRKLGVSELARKVRGD